MSKMASFSRDCTSTQVHILTPVQMMVYNWYELVIKLIYSYISISIVQKYPDVSIPELEFVRICLKNNLLEKYDRAPIKVDVNYLL